MPDKEKNKNSVGVIEPQYFTFNGPLELESGKKLGPVTLAYETYGKLNASRSNAVLVLHAFSGDAHAAGFHKGDDRPGWWDALIGPGKAFDTDKYFVICSNCIGGCQGSTGPSSVNPDTGRPYALDFPIITVADMVNAQEKLITHLGIAKLLCVSGGSMGGMQALQWTASFPQKVASAIPIATTTKHSPQQIAFDEVGRQSVMADAVWNKGNYYDKGHQPERGLAVARMIGHITYMSDQSMEEKFSRKLKEKDFSFSFKSEFEVEGYLRYKGDNFVKRFDANSYLYITKAMDYFDLTNGHGSLAAAFERTQARFLVISFSSDWLYPSYQSQEIVRALRARNCDVAYVELESNYGHDAFLVDVAEQTDLIRGFLASTVEKAS